MAYTIKDLTEFDYEDFMKLTKRELNERLVKMDSIIQRRIKGFEDYNKGRGISHSPALRNYLKKGGTHLGYSDKLYSKEELKDKRLKNIRAEYFRGLNYLKAESSTASGWYKVQTKTLRSIKKITKTRIRHKDFDKFWETYDKLIEQYPELSLPENKYEAFKQAAKLIFMSELAEKDSGAGDSAVISALVDEMTKLYESSQQSMADEISGMFKLKKSGGEEKKKRRKKSTTHKKGDIPDVGIDDLDVDIDIDDLL